MSGEYLNDQMNKLHREDVKNLLSQAYENAIVELQAMAQKNQDKNPQLFLAFIDILNNLKTMEDPKLQVQFDAKYELEFTDKAEIAEEKREVKSYLDALPHLKAKASPIIDYHPVFADSQRIPREAVIANQIQKTLNTVLKADLVKLENISIHDMPAPNFLRISYRIYPINGLYTYYEYDKNNSYNEFLPQLPNTQKREKKILGLLRSYSIDWEVKVYTQKSKEPYTMKMHSDSPDQIDIKPESYSPEWATYSILLYASFCDFSGKLIENFGLPAPSLPRSLGFSDTQN